MAIVLKLAGLERADVHVVTSPLSELVALLHALAEPDHHPETRGLLDEFSAALDPGTAEEFTAFSPLWARFRCRLFFPMSPKHLALDQQIGAVARQPLLEFVRLAAEGIHGYARPLPGPESLLGDDAAQREFLGLCRARSISRMDLAQTLLSDPERFRNRLVDFLRRVDELFFHREWQRVQGQIVRCAQRTEGGLRTKGPLAVLGDVSETATVRTELDEVRFDKLQQRTVTPAGRPLLLVPSVRVAPHLTVKDSPGLPVVVHFSAQGAEPERLSIEQVRARLAALASGTRMEVLRHLCAEPITTSELAARLGQNPAQVSRSLGVLRDAGLVVSQRSGKLVHHRVHMQRVLDLGADILATMVR